MMSFLTSNTAININTQIATADIAQSYSGTCDIVCQNSASNVNIDIVDSIVEGGLNFTQTCTIDATCTQTAVESASATTVLSAMQTSAAASSTGEVLGSNKSINDSYMDMSTDISNSISETCKMTSSNSLNGLTIDAVNSTILGGINVTQSATNSGSCALSGSLTAVASLTGTLQQQASTGKAAKKSSKGIGGMITAGIVAIVLVVVLGIVAKMFASSGKKKPAGKSSKDGKSISSQISDAVHSSVGSGNEIEMAELA